MQIRGLFRDGWKDIFVSRGDVASPNMADRVHVEQPNTVFRNLKGSWATLTEKQGFSRYLLAGIAAPRLRISMAMESSMWL